MIRINIADDLGDNVISTGVVLSVKNKFPGEKIQIDTEHPSLFEHFENVSILKNNVINYDIDLTNYFRSEDHQNELPKSLYVHAIELAQNQFCSNLNLYKPKIELSDKELNWAKNELAKYDKPVIWMQIKSGSKNKDWNNKGWNELENKLSKRYHVLRLSSDDYSPRESLAITKEAFGGITLDSFLLHGSYSVGAKNVIVLLGSSRKEVVGYPGQKVISVNNSCKYAPCGLHKKKSEKNCYFDNFKCMNAIESKMIMEEIRKW